MSTSRHALELLSDDLARVLLWATVAVAIGVMVELASSGKEIRDEWTQHRKISVRHCLTLFGALVVIVGVAIEGYAEYRGAAVEAEIRQDETATEEELRRQVGNVVSAQQPRQLSRVQEENLIVRLSKFNGTTASLWRADTTSSDTVPLAESLQILLRRARWTTHGVEITNAGHADKVAVGVRQGAPASAMDAADALVDELNADGIPAIRDASFVNEETLWKAGVTQNYDTSGVRDVLIFVGTKMPAETQRSTSATSN